MTLSTNAKKIMSEEIKNTVVGNIFFIAKINV
jgi:hypothetical protein